MTQTTDQIRSLANRVHLAGALAELSEAREGTTKDGTPYFSFQGVIQCGEGKIYEQRFKTFVKSKKTDGTDSKNFAKVKEWYANAVPMTKSNNPTMVDMVGSLTDNPYVNSEGKLVEATQYNMVLFGEFKDYAAEIDLEGFIHSIIDETKGVDSDELTGRQRMRLISRDIFSNTLDVKNIIIPKDLVEPLAQNDYERGATAKFFITLLPHDGAAAPVKGGGIGVQRVNTGASYLEWVMTGADAVIDSDSEQALKPEIVKAAMNVRKSNLDEIQSKGYQGNATSSTSTARTGVGSKTTTTKAASTNEEMEDVLNDDDFPF